MSLKNLDIPFSNDVLEKKAYDLIRLHSSQDGWMPTLPIPIEAILERTLDLTLVYDDLSFLGQGVLGSLFPSHKSVYLNENYLQTFEDYPGLHRFTIAHEIGHWEMHVDQHALAQVRLFGDEDDRIICRSGERDTKESVADRFAARLLMPEDLLRESLKCKSVDTVTSFKVLAGSIGVSFSALHYRLSDLGIKHAW